MHVSNYGISNFNTCRQKYKLLKSWEIRAELKSPNLYVGIAFHEGMSSWALKRKEDLAIQKAFETLPEEMEDREKYMELTYALLSAAFEYNTKLPLEVAASETKFEISLMRDVTVKGRFDELINRNNKLWVREFKTSGEKNKSKFFEKYLFDRQALTYVWAASQVLGIRVAGVCVEVAFKPSSGGEGVKIVREYFEYSDEEREKWLHETIQMALDIKNAEEGDVLYREDHSCAGRYSRCEFWDYCSTGERMNVLETTHTKRVEHT